MTMRDLQLYRVHMIAALLERLERNAQGGTDGACWNCNAAVEGDAYKYTTTAGNSAVLCAECAREEGVA